MTDDELETEWARGHLRVVPATLTIGQMYAAKRDAALSIDTPVRDIHKVLAADYDANLRDRSNA